LSDVSNESEHAFNPEPRPADLRILNERRVARLAPPARIELADAAVNAWNSPSAAPDFVVSVRQAIETLSCGEDYPAVRQTAAFVGISVRTLQRRLAQAGASHHRLVAQTRFATAAAVLEQTDAKILELALDLGYSDHANFTRAFRRWAGCAPREYRSKNTPFQTHAAQDDTRPGSIGRMRTENACHD
jgi:AraC-like DNA-binding protein